MSERKINIRDVNPLEHVTSDLEKTRANFESIMNGLVTWYHTESDTVTVRLATDVDPFFVDYNFPSKRAYSAAGTTVSSPDDPPMSLSYSRRVDMAVAAGETAVLRASVTGNSGKWRIYAMAVVNDEGASASATADYPVGAIVRRTSEVEGVVRHADFVVISPVSAGDPWETVTDPNIAPLYTRWDPSRTSEYSSRPLAFVEYGVGPTDTAVWFLSGSPSGGSPESDRNAWTRVAWSWNSLPGSDEVLIEEGAPVFYKVTDSPEESGEVYVRTGHGVAKKNCVPPYSAMGRDQDTDDWASRTAGTSTVISPVVIYPVADVSSTRVVRHEALTDLAGFVAMPLSVPDDGAELRVAATVAVQAGTSQQPGGIRVLRTSNYVNWPASTGPKWDAGTVYDYSSDYTAKMVFHHRGADARKVNVVNYDGPDLDRGLAIYLPVNDPAEVTPGVESDCTPEDGYTVEFMFRIWPTPGLTGAESADLVINKAQIYVYSAAGTSEQELASAVTIAKFSMARMTTFHVWAENIAVPNRPVFYKAKFVYSAAAGNWVTYDYYQVPDCVFLSQGFVDPENPGYGVETAGFPMMRDIFTSTDMGRAVPAE